MSREIRVENFSELEDYLNHLSSELETWGYTYGHDKAEIDVEGTSGQSATISPKTDIKNIRKTLQGENQFLTIEEIKKNLVITLYAENNAFESEICYKPSEDNIENIRTRSKTKYGSINSSEESFEKTVKTHLTYIRDLSMEETL